MSVCSDPGLVVNCEQSMAEMSWLLTADLSFEKRVRCFLCKGSSPLGECRSKVDFSAYKCKKAVVIHLGTNNITTDDSPKTIASKLAEVGKTIQRGTEAQRIIISGIISRQDTRVGFKIADTNCEIKSMCAKME